VSVLLGSALTDLPMLPLFIFIAEMCVVTLSTIRTIFVARGMKYLAPLLGFFEVSIWLFAIGEVMKNLNQVSCYAAFAGGFTLGNFLGVLIEKKLAMGSAVVRIITCKNTAALIEGLRAANYGVTCVDGQGSKGPVQIILTVIKRKDLGKVLTIIHTFDPDVFYSIDELQTAARGVFPLTRGRLQMALAGVCEIRETADREFADLARSPRRVESANPAGKARRNKVTR
jgi:uncharacterized protein YebE (UPF0316 family)